MDNGEDVIIVDVNPTVLYNTAHIPGAISLPWDVNGYAGSPDLSKSALLVFYCDCATEEDSGSMGLSAVTEYGYRNIMLLKGGQRAWKNAGYPMESST